MRGKKKKGRVIKPGQETTDKVATGLLNKLGAAGVDLSKLPNAKADGDNSILDQSTWTYYSESTNVDTQLDQSHMLAAAGDINLKADLEDMDKKEEEKKEREEFEQSMKNKSRDKTVDVGQVIDSQEMEELKVDLSSAKQKRLEEMISSERAKQVTNEPTTDRTNADVQASGAIQESSDAKTNDVAAENKDDDSKITKDDDQKPSDEGMKTQKTADEKTETLQKNQEVKQDAVKAESTEVKQPQQAAEPTVDKTDAQPKQIDPVKQPEQSQSKPVDAPEDDKLQSKDTKPVEKVSEKIDEPKKDEKQESSTSQAPVTQTTTPQTDKSPEKKKLLKELSTKKRTMKADKSIKMIDTTTPSEKTVSAPVEQVKPSQDVDEPEPEAASNTMLYVGLVVAAAAAGGLAYFLTRKKS